MEAETYEDLISWMTRRGNKAALSAAVSYLEREVAAEAEVLATMSINNGEFSRRSKKLRDACREDAEAHYLAEINEFLAAPSRDLTPMELVSYRRRPHAWAVASMIQDHLEKK
jgi:hypothetical protein